MLTKVCCCEDMNTQRQDAGCESLSGCAHDTCSALGDEFLLANKLRRSLLVVLLRLLDLEQGLLQESGSLWVRTSRDRRSVRSLRGVGTELPGCIGVIMRTT